MQISRGVLYMILAALSFSFVGLGVKLLKHISNLEVNFFKAIICMLLCYTVAQHKQISIWGHNKQLLWARGVTGALAIILYFVTLEHMPLAIATILQNTCPIFTAILSIFMLQQSVTFKQWLCFALAMMGVILANGVDAVVTPLYVLLGLTSAFSMGITNNLNTLLKDKEGPIVIIFYMSLFTALGTVGFLFQDFTPLHMPDLLILLGIGLCTFLADVLAIRAFQLASVAQVSAVSYLGIPYSLILGFTFLGEVYTWVHLLGMGCVVSGSLLSIDRGR